MVNPSTESSPDAHSASNVGADDKGNASGTTRSEDSVATTIPPDPPADDKADERKQEDDKKEVTVLSAAAETKPQPETTADISASSNHKVAESKPEESSVSGTATAMQSKSENGTREGSTKGEDENAADQKVENTDASVAPVVSATKRTRPPYKYDPEKVTLRFLFANKDGLTVTVECKPGDTVGDVKGQLLSVWPEDLPDCSGGDHVRLICMGKGILMPDSRTLEDCQVPVFKTHPTPINVSVRPKASAVEPTKGTKEKTHAVGGASSSGSPSGRTAEQTSQGCGCLIQ